MDREMDPVTELLPEDLLREIRARAADVDRENRFCDEDFEALREIGYLRMLVPEEFGGLGFTLEQASRAQRRLAGAAPATALGINMHHVIVGIGYTLHRRGDERARRIFEDAVAGVQAGRSGGFGHVIGVNRKDHQHGRALASAGADQVVTDLQDLL